MDFSLMGTAWAAGEAPAVAAPQQSIFEMMVPFVLIFVAMYFIMIRPQAKKAREHGDLLKTLKPGDEVITSGGIIARIKSVADEFVTLDVGNASLKILKDHVVRYSKKQGDAAPKKTESDK
jgi:preprotein translocase subunit YajC